MPLSVKVFDLFCSRTEEHIVGKHIRPGIFRYHADVETEFLVGAGIRIAYIYIAAVQVSFHAVVKRIELLS